MLREKYPKMKMFGEAKLQSKGRNFFVETLIFLVVLIVTSLCASLPSIVYETVGLMKDPHMLDVITQFNSGAISYDEYIEEFTKFSTEGWAMVVSLYGTGISTLVTFAYVRFIEKRKLSTMGFRKNGWLKEYAVGMLIGLSMFSLAVGICLVSGALTFAGVTNRIPWLMIGCYFVGFLIQGMSEEVTFRGYFMVSLSRRSHIALAAALSSIAFGCAHLGNPGVTALPIVNIVLFGAFEALYIMKRGNIWGVCGIHSLWNFVQGNFYGIQVSGLSKMDTVLNMESSGSALINGGDFGLEGGLAVTAVLVVSIVVLTFTKPKAFEVMTAEEISALESVSDNNTDDTSNES